MVAYNAQYYKDNKDTMDKRTAAYHEKHTVFVGMRLNKERDGDIIAKLNSFGKNEKTGYIRQLIRDDIKRTGWQVPDVQTDLPPVEPVPTVEMPPVEPVPTTDMTLEKDDAMKLLGL